LICFLLLKEESAGKLLAKVASHQDGLTGCTFHPLDNHLLITYGKACLTFWTVKKDGFFERTDMVRETEETNVTATCICFMESGDVVVGDDAGLIRVYSVSNVGEYYKSTEFQAHKVRRFFQGPES